MYRKLLPYMEFLHFILCRNYMIKTRLSNIRSVYKTVYHKAMCSTKHFSVPIRDQKEK